MFTPVAELPFQSAFNYKEGSTTVLNLVGGFNISQHYVSTSRYVNWLCFSCFLAFHLVTSTFTLCGRRGTWRHQPSLCVAGVALVVLGCFLCCFSVHVLLGRYLRQILSREVLLINRGGHIVSKVSKN